MPNDVSILNFCDRGVDYAGKWLRYHHRKSSGVKIYATTALYCVQHRATLHSPTIKLYEEDISPVKATSVDCQQLFVHPQQPLSHAVVHVNASQFVTLTPDVIPTQVL